MASKIDWETQIGRRLKLRDLHVLMTVVERGSMAKAAEHLGVSQPAISELIAELEHAVGVRLLERSSRGIEPTTYGKVLIQRSGTVFDELKQGIRDIEFLADPSAGELRVGCADSVSSGILVPVLHEFAKRYPRIVVHLTASVSPRLEVPELRARNLDLAILRLSNKRAVGADDLNIEVLYIDRMVIAAGKHTPWAKRNKLDLAELADEPWLLNPPHSWNYIKIQEAFRERGLDMPQISLMTFSIHARAHMVASGPYISAFPATFMDFNAARYAMQALAVDLPELPWPLAVATLKHRTLSPVARLFIDQLRASTAALTAAAEAEPPRAYKRSV